MRTTILLFAAVITLSSCGTTPTGERYIGEPYIQPTTVEPAAEIVLPKEQMGEISLEIVNADKKGCYSGKLVIPQAKEEAGKTVGYRVHADKRLVLRYDGYFKQEGRYSSPKCGFEFYFTPKKDAKYSVVPGQITLRNEKASMLSRFLQRHKQDYCTVNMIEETADGVQSTAQLHKTGPRQRGFACIKF